MLFDWPPILWAARTLVNGELPPLRGLKGTFRILGQVFELDAGVESRQDVQLLALKGEIAHLDEVVSRHGDMLKSSTGRAEEDGIP